MNTKKERLSIPQQEYSHRIAKVQQAMKEAGIDVILTHSCGCESANSRYLTGFWAVFDFVGILIPREGKAQLLTGGPESYDFAKDFACVDEVTIHPLYVETSAPVWDRKTENNGFRKILDGIREYLPVKTVGIANSNIMPQAIMEDLMKTLDGAKLVTADELIMKVRWLKSDAEIALLRKAFSITEESMKKAVEIVRPGVCEWEVEAAWTANAFSMGAEGTSYYGWCTSGERMFQSLCQSSDRAFQQNDAVQISFGAKYNGYCGNMCRPVILGDIAPEKERLIQTALDCMLECIEIVGPGVPFSRIYDAFMASLQRHGYAGCNLYGPAHGTGMQECEGPWVDNRTALTMEPNMVFNVDIWIAKDGFGTRFEDGVLITPTGAELLTNWRQEIIRV